VNALEQKIIERIKREGPITFERFMEAALYDSDFGYYTSHTMRIGREGDFYTSSHLHPVFGAMVGRQIEEMWKFMGRPADFTTVEMGAGAGFVCKDMLDYHKATGFFRSLRYIIIERNPSLRELQEDLLAGYAGIVEWVGSLQEVGGIRGCIFSNELLDAFPVHLVSMEEELKEIYVAASEFKVREEPGPLSTDGISEYVRAFSLRLEKGYRTEVNLRIKEWLKDIDAVLAEGFAFTIDYGYTAREYYSEERDRGTLMCYYRHQLSEDPLQNIGEQDITAHVNFSSVSRWGEEIGLKTLGFCGQGAFLVSLGIDEEIRDKSSGSKDSLFDIARIKNLILPQGMGESHVVMIQYKGEGVPELRGFSVRNRIKYL
jgi:SAM-dependent MidA family methyltransferase